MNISKTEYQYESGLPFRVEICSIHRTAPHYHDESLELVFCLQGSITYVAGMQTATIREGQLESIDCEDIHYLFSNEPNTVLFLHLNLKEMPIPWETLINVFFTCEEEGSFHYQQEPLRQVKDLALALSYIYFSSDPSAFDSETSVNELINILYRYFNYYTYGNPDGHMNPELRDRFISIMGYCFDNYTSKISVAQIAEYSHISGNYLSQYFSKTPFKTFGSMLKNIRCFRAERLLLTTNMSNADVAFACGFSDPKYFYWAFNDWWGCTPNAHRKKYKEYMKNTEDYKTLSRRKSFSIIRKAIINWHMEKSTTKPLA